MLANQGHNGSGIGGGGDGGAASLEIFFLQTS